MISNVCAVAAGLLGFSEKLTLPLRDLITVAVKIISFSPVSFSRVAHFLGVDGKRRLNIRHEKSDNAQTSLRPLEAWN